MSGKGQSSLTAEQRALVREHLGLVGVHLRRHVRSASVRRGSEGWEELFQEGCLGLMRAAAEFDLRRGIPFAAFALPRIHYAVSQALWASSGTKRVHKRKSSADGEPGSERRRHDPTARPGGLEHPERVADRRRAPDPDGVTDKTVGGMLREKYERAVRSAAEEVAARTSSRGDLGRLVRVLVEERFLIPDDEARHALRRIARETQSSWARVSQCDRQLLTVIRKKLESDPEFMELRNAAREDDRGVERPLDGEVDGLMVRASTKEFVRRYQAADRAGRSELLAQVLDLSGRGVENLILERFSRLSAEGREGVLGRG